MRNAVKVTATALRQNDNWLIKALIGIDSDFCRHFSGRRRIREDIHGNSDVFARNQKEFPRGQIMVFSEKVSLKSA